MVLVTLAKVLLAILNNLIAENMIVPTINVPNMMAIITF